MLYINHVHLFSLYLFPQKIEDFVLQKKQVANINQITWGGVGSFGWKTFGVGSLPPKGDGWTKTHPVRRCVQKSLDSSSWNWCAHIIAKLTSKHVSLELNLLKLLPNQVWRYHILDPQICSSPLLLKNGDVGNDFPKKPHNYPPSSRHLPHTCSCKEMSIASMDFLKQMDTTRFSWPKKAWGKNHILKKKKRWRIAATTSYHPCIPSLKLTACPKNWWLEDDSFPFGIRLICRGELLVLGRVLYLYLHLLYVHDKSREIYHTWMVCIMHQQKETQIHTMEPFRFFPNGLVAMNSSLSSTASNLCGGSAG